MFENTQSKEEALFHLDLIDEVSNQCISMLSGTRNGLYWKQKLKWTESRKSTDE